MKPKIEIYSLFPRKFFRHNYQLLWNDKETNAINNFYSLLNSQELLPFIHEIKHEHPQKYNLTYQPTQEIITHKLDNAFIGNSITLPDPIRTYMNINPTSDPPHDDLLQIFDPYNGDTQSEIYL